MRRRNPRTQDPSQEVAESSGFNPPSQEVPESSGFNHPSQEVAESSGFNHPRPSATKSDSTSAAKLDSTNVYGWPYRGPAWLGKMLALDVRSIALFRVLVGGIGLWEVCHDFLPDAQWFLHDSG